MDSVRGVFRLGLWFGCLLCVLPIANATTVPVVVPSAHATVKNSSGVTVSGNSLRVTGPLQGTFIPADGPGSRVSLKVKPAVDFSVGRIINQVKPLVRKGFAPALGLAGVVWAINQLPGASFDPQTGLPLVTPSFTPSGTIWQANAWSGGTMPQNFSSHTTACDALRPIKPSYMDRVYTKQADNYYMCNLVDRFTGYSEPQGWAVSVRINCPNGFNSVTLSCNTTPIAPVPFTEQDYAFVDSKLDAIVNPEWLRDILLTSCSGASNPENCADFLKDWQANIVGPATVPGSTTTTTSTYVKPDGTVGTKGSTTTNNYKVTYGPTSFTFNKTSTTTYTQDGVETGTDVTEETPAPDEEPTPPEEEQEESSPCTTDCDGPEYEDLYEPTEDTKEDHIDSYSNRVSDIPIIAAVGGLFDVSVSVSSCPTWSYNSTLDIGVASMPIDLNFDFHCLPWFVSLGPWIQTIFLLGCTLAAIRIGIL